MAESRPRARPESDAEPMTRTYVKVLAVEILVLFLLWLFSRHFA
jgi:hypothetical protein